MTWVDVLSLAIGMTLIGYITWSYLGAKAYDVGSRWRRLLRWLRDVIDVFFGV